MEPRKKGKAQVPQPALIANYNKYMGGVHHQVWLLEMLHFILENAT